MLDLPLIDSPPASSDASSLAPLPADLRARFFAVRAHTQRLAAPLSAEDCCVQSMPDASPAKWHLAHTTWFFETFVLARWERGFAPHGESFAVLFNSYYQSVGARHPRPQRGMLTRPSLGEVQAYRQAIDERMARLLSQPLPSEALQLIELGLQHEEQHQELLLTDLKHLLSLNPLQPAYRATAPRTRRQPRQIQWRRFDGGVVRVGAGERGFAFDNERPRHDVLLAPFALADRLVTNGEYAEFIADGGYAQPQWWLAEGFDGLQDEAVTQPLYWRQDGAKWHEFTLHGLQPLDPGAPVCHLSYFEADAYARWAGARLPTEFEWEHAARQCDAPASESTALHPAVSGAPFEDLYGAVWQWTSSSYAPYPGFSPAAGAVGEYNGKFMVNQYVLRGSSCATPAGHSRASYRNFFPTSARWQFTGLRLARLAG